MVSITLKQFTLPMTKLSLSACDINGNIGYSETIEFTVSEKEPFPTVLVAAVSAAFVAVGIVGALLIYRRNHKPKSSKT
jgi:hypothetical protein